MQGVSPRSLPPACSAHLCLCGADACAVMWWAYLYILYVRARQDYGAAPQSRQSLASLSAADNRCAGLSLKLAAGSGRTRPSLSQCVAALSPFGRQARWMLDRGRHLVHVPDAEGFQCGECGSGVALISSPQSQAGCLAPA
ncbi:hypothetical protein BDV95DRAFT_595489 [Massariosphaeria phaeospora]|uniref:Uncharacterized protein n=1 Tax=Massariosphaeria phaeospora TaxID=100035 RepID=A0A7C8M7H7_9PLEO|nr:hypothetical protein BDV95DRAFT_595489 [Massariosphaeria phaeospora]